MRLNFQRLLKTLAIFTKRTEKSCNRIDDFSLRRPFWATLNWSFQIGLCSMVLTFCAATLGIAAETNQSDAAQLLLSRGDELMGRREYDEAIAQYTKAIELRPDFAEAYNNRGYAVYSKYDGSDPLADLNRAIELRPNFAHAYNTRGCIYMARGQADLAIADFGRAIALQPDYQRAFRNRANVLMKKGRVREAFADFKRAGINPWRIAGIIGSIILAFSALGVWLLRSMLRRKGASGVGPKE